MHMYMYFKVLATAVVPEYGRIVLDSRVTRYM